MQAVIIISRDERIRSDCLTRYQKVFGSIIPSQIHDFVCFFFVSNSLMPDIVHTCTSLCTFAIWYNVHVILKASWYIHVHVHVHVRGEII